MNFTGLSLEQAPPLSAPVRFFVTALFFLMAAAVAMMSMESASVSTRYTTEAIALTHLFTLGVFAFIMLGALQQMLPVLAGVALPHALRIASVSHILLSIGVTALFFGLFFTITWLLVVALGALSLGFILIFGGIIGALIEVKHLNATVRAMGIAVIIGGAVVLMGMQLLGTHIVHNMTQDSYLLATVHSVWGIFGFAGILAVGVSFQILPMFYVTDAFSKYFSTYAIIGICAALLVWLLLNMEAAAYAMAARWSIALFFIVFGWNVLRKLKVRKRQISDVTVWYWQLSAYALMAGVVVWSVDAVIDYELSLLSALLIGGGFILSLMSGMLYKIIPFLVWFHLNAKGYMTIPTMREMIAEPMAEIQFVLHVLTLLLCIPFAFGVDTLQAAGAMLLGSSAILLVNLLRALHIYRTTLQRAPDFDTSMMTL